MTRLRSCNYGITLYILEGDCQGYQHVSKLGYPKIHWCPTNNQAFCTTFFRFQILNHAQYETVQRISIPNRQWFSMIFHFEQVDPSRGTRRDGPLEEWWPFTQGQGLWSWSWLEWQISLGHPETRCKWNYCIPSGIHVQLWLHVVTGTPITSSWQLGLYGLVPMVLQASCWDEILLSLVLPKAAEAPQEVYSFKMMMLFDSYAWIAEFSNYIWDLKVYFLGL